MQYEKCSPTAIPAVREHFAYFLYELIGCLIILIIDGMHLRHQDHQDLQVHPGSEEHTSELQSQFRISYAVFCLKKIKDIMVFHEFVSLCVAVPFILTDP